MSDLIEKCPPAEACRDAFDRMSRATIAMCQSTTGFGTQVKYSLDLQSPIAPQRSQLPPISKRNPRPPPTFDYNLKDLFPDQPFSTNPTFAEGWQFPPNRSTNVTYNNFPASNNIVSLPSSDPPAPQYDPRLFSAQVKLEPLQQPLDRHQQPSNIPTTTGPNFAFNPNIDLTNLPDFDFLVQDDQTTGNASYNNLGFEGDHRDFDDGESGAPDIFDGFFFGGPNNSGLNDLEMGDLNEVNSMGVTSLQGMNDYV